jgi:hypothetical protein
LLPAAVVVLTQVAGLVNPLFHFSFSGHSAAIVTTTLQDLEAAAGKALTGGGSALPMSDLIRMAGHAHHYSPASGRYPQASSTMAKPWRCITPNVWPLPPSGSCCTPVQSEIMHL